LKSILAAFIGLMLASSCQRAEPETYLIPANFTGRVQIIFNQNGAPYKYRNEYNRDTIYTPKMGELAKYENGRRVYEIPSNGVLLTQFKSNDGFIDKEYYSVESNGKRIRLEVYELDHYKKDSTRWVVKDVNQKGVFDGVVGSIGNMNIPFQFFIVSSLKMLDTINNKNRIDSFNTKVDMAIGVSY